MEGRQSKNKYTCKPCRARCHNVTNLYCHMSGQKHRNHLKRVRPELDPRLDGLQYFLDTYAAEEPLLGLGYIVETQGEEYLYKCKLCAIDMDKGSVYNHIMGVMHVKKYLDRHHPEKADYIDHVPPPHQPAKLLMVSIEIIKSYGKEKIQERKMEAEGAPPAKEAKLSPSRWDVPAAAPPANRSKNKSGTSGGQGKSDLYQKILDKMKFLQFGRNAEFLDFMRTVHIGNNEDVIFAKGIMLNCATALQRFREEQADVAEEGQKPPSCSRTTVAHTDGAEPRQCGMEEVQVSPYSGHKAAVQTEGAMQRPTNKEEVVQVSPYNGHKTVAHTDGTEQMQASMADEMQQSPSNSNTIVACTDSTNLKRVNAVEVQALPSNSHETVAHTDGTDQRQANDVEAQVSPTAVEHTDRTDQKPMAEMQKSPSSVHLTASCTDRIDRQQVNRVEVQAFPSSSRQTVVATDQRQASMAETQKSPSSSHTTASCIDSADPKQIDMVEYPSSSGKTVAHTDGSKQRQSNMEAMHVSLCSGYDRTVHKEVTTELQEPSSHTTMVRTHGTDQKTINVETAPPTCSHATATHREGDDHTCNVPNLNTTNQLDLPLAHRPGDLNSNGTTRESKAAKKSDAMEVFFSRIKNLQASEVTAVFEKVFATHPSFKGINIPNLIKYLQDTGKLKKT